MNTRIYTIASSLTLSLFVASFSAVAQNLIQNGDFEAGNWTVGSPNPGSDSLAVGSTAIADWTTVNAEISWNVSPITPLNHALDTLTAPNGGTYFLDLTGYHNASPYGGVSQTISTVVGQTYLMSFYLGSDYSENGSYGDYVIDPGVSVSINGAQVFSALTPVNDLSQPSFWLLESFGFTATSTSSTIALTGISPADNNPYIGLDDVSVQAIPEPSSFALILTGIAGLSLAGKRSGLNLNCFKK